MDEEEIRNLKWWSDYHKESAKWLTIRIHQVLVEGREDIIPILLGSLPVYMEEYAHPSLCHFSDPEVKPDETSTETTE